MRVDKSDWVFTDQKNFSLVLACALILVSSGPAYVDVRSHWTLHIFPTSWAMIWYFPSPDSHYTANKHDAVSSKEVIEVMLTLAEMFPFLQTSAAYSYQNSKLGLQHRITKLILEYEIFMSHSPPSALITMSASGTARRKAHGVSWLKETTH